MYARKYILPDKTEMIAAVLRIWRMAEQESTCLVKVGTVFSPLFCLLLLAIWKLHTTSHD